MGSGTRAQKSAPKSRITLFASETCQSQYRPPVKLDHTPLPLERHPMLLGLTFDLHQTIHQHIKILKEQTTELLKFLKALAGTNWGQQKETITMTYKALKKSKLAHTASVWFPNISTSAGQMLQAVQNAAVRVATGCHQRASLDQLHAGTQLLSVVKSLEMACSQYLKSALRTSHPSHSIVTQSSGHPIKKDTLQSKFLPSIAYLSNGVILANEY